MNGANFTNKAQDALMQAQQLAQEKGQSQIDALHLLSVLLSQEGSIVITILQKLGVDADALIKKSWWANFKNSCNFNSADIWAILFDTRYGQSFR